jgi:hypothetical protein
MVLLAGVALNLILATVTLGVFPEVLGGERTVWIGADCFLLLAYVAWLVLAPAPHARSVAFGAAAGLVQFADITREYFTAWPSGFLALAMLVSVGLFAAAGAPHRPIQGAIQGAHSAVAAMLLLWALAWALDAIAPDRIGAALSTDPDYLRSGLHDLRTYVAWNTLSAAFSHALLLPLIGAGAGAAAGALRQSWSLRKSASL